MDRAGDGGTTAGDGVRSGRTLILGVGSSIRRDDGAGPEAARLLHESLGRDDVDFAEAAFGGMRLLDLLAGYERAVVIDALRDPSLPAGELVRIELSAGGTANLAGSHGFGLLDALRTAAALGIGLPERVSLYGIAARELDSFGEGLSPEVAARLPRAVAEIRRCEFGPPPCMLVAGS